MDTPLPENMVCYKGLQAWKMKAVIPQTTGFSTFSIKTLLHYLVDFSSGPILKESVKQNFMCGIKIYQLFCRTFKTLSCFLTLSAQAESPQKPWPTFCCQYM